MGKLLFVGTYATDDPTRATMPFLVAWKSLDRGHTPAVAIMGEAVYLMKEGAIDTIQGVGFPSLREIFDELVDHGVPVYV